MSLFIIILILIITGLCAWQSALYLQGRNPANAGAAIFSAFVVLCLNVQLLGELLEPLTYR